MSSLGGGHGDVVNETMRRVADRAPVRQAPRPLTRLDRRDVGTPPTAARGLWPYPEIGMVEPPARQNVEDPRAPVGTTARFRIVHDADRRLPPRRRLDAAAASV